MATPFRRALGLGHGAYYLASGLWPVLSMRTFEAVTGPKHDDWLVKTVGALAAAVGAVLLVRAARGEADPLLGMATAAAFAAVDVRYVATGTIRPIYLADAAAELGLASGWLAATVLQRRSAAPRHR